VFLGSGHQTIRGTADSSASPVQNVGVNHRRFDVTVAKEFLHGPDIIAIGQQVRGEGMPKRVARDSFGQSGLSDSLQDRLLNKRFVNVVPALLAGLGVSPTAFLWEYELPAPLAIGVRILPGQRMRQFHAAVTVRQVLLVNLLDAPKVLLQGADHRPRHRRDTVFVSLPFADGDLAALEVQVFDPQAEGLQKPESSPVQQHPDQPFVAVQVRQEPRYFIDGQDNREPLGATGANDAFDPVERLLEDVLVEEQDRGESLVLCRGRNVFFDGQMREKAVDIAFGQLARVPACVELDVPANPVEVGLFRAAAVMPHPQNLNDAVVETGR